jgi:hypothetical protein
MRLVVKKKKSQRHEYGVWDLDAQKFVAHITACPNRGGQQGYRVTGITKIFSSPSKCLDGFIEENNIS